MSDQSLKTDDQKCGRCKHFDHSHDHPYGVCKAASLALPHALKRWLPDVSRVALLTVDFSFDGARCISFEPFGK
ncbi:hypothetical protein [Terasakiella sp.]|uniref:hypothetical protein n=1 Tax=Terasakiella sp. TaxID=2034861 RepID=UPI003AA865B4